MEPFLVKNDNIPSGDYICLASRLSETGHENRLSSHLPKLGYPRTSHYILWTLDSPELILFWLCRTAIDTKNKIDALLMGHKNPHYEEFWLK